MTVIGRHRSALWGGVIGLGALMAVAVPGAAPAEEVASAAISLERTDTLARLDRQLDLYAASQRTLDARLQAETQRLAAADALFARIASGSRPPPATDDLGLAALIAQPTPGLDSVRAASLAAGARRAAAVRLQAVRQALAELAKATELARQQRQDLLAVHAALGSGAAATPSGAEAGILSFAAGERVLRLPVDGTVVTGFGDVEDGGLTSRGLVLAAPSLAEVVAPAAGHVRFAGTFRSYGHVLIIDHGGGYHSLLAGMGRIDADVETRVAGGQPVGTMTDTSQRQPRLLFELWRERAPIDPRPWVPVLNVKGKG